MSLAAISDFYEIIILWPRYFSSLSLLSSYCLLLELLQGHPNSLFGFSLNPYQSILHNAVQIIFIQHKAVTLPLIALKFQYARQGSQGQSQSGPCLLCTSPHLTFYRHIKLLWVTHYSLIRKLSPDYIPRLAILQVYLTYHFTPKAFSEPLRFYWDLLPAVLCAYCYPLLSQHLPHFIETIYSCFHTAVVELWS